MPSTNKNGLDLPLYLLVGAQPVSFEPTESGGALLLGWDFAKGEMTQDAASWDDVIGADGEAVKITKEEFDAAVNALKLAVA